MPVNYNNASPHSGITNASSHPSRLPSFLLLHFLALSHPLSALLILVSISTLISLHCYPSLSPCSFINSPSLLSSSSPSLRPSIPPVGLRRPTSKGLLSVFMPWYLSCGSVRVCEDTPGSLKYYLTTPVFTCFLLLYI